MYFFATTNTIVTISKDQVKSSMSFHFDLTFDIRPSIPDL